MQEAVLLQELVKNISSGVGILDYNGRIIVSNRDFDIYISERKEQMDKFIKLLKENKNVSDISIPLMNDDMLLRLKLSKNNPDNNVNGNYIFVTYDNITEKLGYFKMNEEKHMLEDMIINFVAHDIQNYSQIILSSFEFLSTISDNSMKVYEPLKSAVNDLDTTVKAIRMLPSEKKYTIVNLVNYIIPNYIKKDVRIEKRGLKDFEFKCSPMSRYALLTFLKRILENSKGNYAEFTSQRDADNIRFNIKNDGVYLPSYIMDFISTEYYDKLENINKIYSYLYSDSFITKIFKNDNIFMDISVEYDGVKTFTNISFSIPISNHFIKE